MANRPRSAIFEASETSLMSIPSQTTTAPAGAASVPRFRTLHLVLVLAIFAADQISKGIIQRLPDYASIPVIPHLFRIVHVENPGVAFGLFQNAPEHWRVLLIVVSSLALLFVLGLLWRSQQSARTGVALAMIFGGAIGNLFDRIVHGQVVDFLLFYIGRHTWPAFNIADSAIVIGAGILVWEILWENRSSAHTGA